MRFWGAFVGMVLSACSQLVIAPAQVRVVITPPISTAGLDPSRCYAIHVSGDHRDLKQDEFAGGQCREGASGVGLYSGLHSVGDEVTLTVPAGPKRRIDLLSLPKPESGCSRDFQLQATAPGVFVARVQGAISSEAPKLVATNTVDIVPGPQTVALQSLDPGSVLASQNYTCTGAPKITTAKRLANGSLEIKGSDLDSVDQVRIEGGSTIPLSIVSKSWDTLVARTQSAASVVLGGAYSLVVTSAFGQATTSLNVELSPGSVRPEHLDLNLSWPFVPMTSVSLPAMTIGNSSIDFGNMGNWYTLRPGLPTSSFSDRSGGAFYDLEIPSGTTFREGLVIDLGAHRPHTAWIRAEIMNPVFSESLNCGCFGDLVPAIDTHAVSTPTDDPYLGCINTPMAQSMARKTSRIESRLPMQTALTPSRYLRIYCKDMATGYSQPWKLRIYEVEVKNTDPLAQF